MEGLNSAVVTWSWVMLVLFIGFMMYLGYLGMKKTKNADDFATARASYGPIVLGLAVASTIASGSTFMGMPGLAYTKGFPSLWYPILYPIGAYFGMLLTAKMVRAMGEKFGNRTIPEIVGERYKSDFLRIGVAILSLLLIYYVVSQLVAAAIMFETMMGLNYEVALWLTAVVLGIYLTIGGSHSDIMTDAVQGVFMLAIAVLVLFMFIFGVGTNGGGMAAVNEGMVEVNPAAGWDSLFIPGDPTYGSLWLVLLLLIAHIPFGVQPHIGNKFIALKNSRQLKIFFMFVIIAGTILPMMALGGILGAAVLEQPLQHADQVIPALFIELFPPFVAALLAVGILSAILSTSDGLIVAFSQIFANDFYRKTIAKNNPNKEKVEKNSLLISQVAVVATILFGVWMAYDPPKALAVFLWIGIGGLMAGLVGPLAIGGVWRRANTQGATASFLTGAITYAVLYQGWLPGLEAITNPFAASGYSVLIASAVMVVVTLMTKPMDEDYIRELYGPDKGPTVRDPRMPANK